MALMEEGRETGYMPPRILMERIPAQIAAQLVEDPAESPFFKAFVTMPSSIESSEQERLRSLARDVIDDTIVPAYREFSDYFNEVYLPASRESIGASALPNGEAFYESAKATGGPDSLAGEWLDATGVEINLAMKLLNAFAFSPGTGLVYAFDRVEEKDRWQLYLSVKGVVSF